ncbi:hypothetical protein BOVAC1_326 [Bacteroides ovatus]|nr:hypothetical protein BOVAC1_326 [Bacteroides ovatus]
MLYLITTHLWKTYYYLYNLFCRYIDYTPEERGNQKNRRYPLRFNRIFCKEYVKLLKYEKSGCYQLIGMRYNCLK